MRVADYVFERLIKLGVSHVYSVTGRGSLFLTDAIAKLDSLQNISMHHEQSAGYAANAHAQLTGELAVCLISTGCGSTNAVTPVLNAWQDGLPVIFISGQNFLRETTSHSGLNIRTHGQQEADIVSIVRPITKFAKMIHNPNEIISVLDEAIKLAVSGRQGPVWIDIPLDVQSGQIDNTNVDFSPVLTEKIKTKLEEINVVAEILNASKRPVILIGSGVRHSRGIESLITLAKNLSIPIVYTSSSADIYGSKNYGSIGSVGTMGCSRAGNIVTHSADVLLVLGNRLTSMTTGANPEDFAPNATKIFVDVDSEEAKKSNLSINKVIVCDSKYFTDHLNEKIFHNLHSKWLKKCETIKIELNQLEDDFKSNEKIDLYDLTLNLSKRIPNEINIVTDSGLCELIIPTNIDLEKKQRLIHPTSQGSMGFAIPGAIGAYLASKTPTLVIVGDGSIMMNLQELETIKYNKLPIKIMVINNDAYSIIRKRQKELFRGRTIGTDSKNGLSCPNFEEVASLFKFKYMKLEDKNKITEVIDEMLECKEAVLCEVLGKENQDYVQAASRMGEDGRFQKMPLYNQHPFTNHIKHEMAYTNLVKTN